jgi:hypothetical protein
MNYGLFLLVFRWLMIGYFIGKNAVFRLANGKTHHKQPEKQTETAQISIIMQKWYKVPQNNKSAAKRTKSRNK